MRPYTTTRHLDCCSRAVSLVLSLPMTELCLKTIAALLQRWRPPAVSTIPPSPFLARKGVMKPNTGGTPVPPAKGLRPLCTPRPVHGKRLKAKPLDGEG